MPFNVHAFPHLRHCLRHPSRRPSPYRFIGYIASMKLDQKNTNDHFLYFFDVFINNYEVRWASSSTDQLDLMQADCEPRGSDLGNRAFPRLPFVRLGGLGRTGIPAACSSIHLMHSRFLALADQHTWGGCPSRQALLDLFHISLQPGRALQPPFKPSHQTRHTVGARAGPRRWSTPVAARSCAGDKATPPAPADVPVMTAPRPSASRS